MGNVLSVWSGRASRATSVQDTMDPPDGSDSELQHTIEDEARNKAKQEDMAEFMKQLNAKREQRKEILDRHRAEKKNLEASLDNERKAKLDAYETNKQLRKLLIDNGIDIPEELQSAKEDKGISETIGNMKEEFERLRDSNTKLRRTLAETTSALQSAYSDIADLQGENTESIKQISALKEVVNISKTMINLREEQISKLKDKLTEIEQSLADREASTLSVDLRNEYVRQLQNIRTLRGLYEERARLAEVTKQSLVRDLEEQKALKESEIQKCNDLKSTVDNLEAKVDELLEKVANKESQISASKAETHGLKNEMSVVNKLFSQVLLGYKDKKDLDTLVHRLEENHDLLTHMAEKENGSEASTELPKLLLELVSQVDEGEVHKDEIEDEKKTKTTTEESSDEQESQNTKAEEIVQNLPKVWRVLIELLSHQSASEENITEKVTTCYKTVETKSGPVQVPSVSQTYIRLKDLIVEKLALVKEVNRMKQLNTHLESRLDVQEKRLCLVTSELSKTWHVVGRLRRHHHQLHTHEKILKYELQQKRKLLNELKEELEYCREKWEQAREKNTQSERDLKKLRAEFVSRKQVTSFNTSAESGYSDERPSDDSDESNDESEFIEPLARSKKKLKKSFEHVLDSSADFNLVAEREDPASDLLDVADLPLDTHESDNTHDISDSCNSESLLKSERICEETEDELGDIANEEVAECSQISEPSNAFTSKESDETLEKFATDDTSKCAIQETKSQSVTTVPTIDPAAILKSIKEQNERLANRDKKLEKLEKSGSALLKQTQGTIKLSDQINATLDHLLNRPSSSRIGTSQSLEMSQSPQGPETSQCLILDSSHSSVITQSLETDVENKVSSPKNCEATVIINKHTLTSSDLPIIIDPAANLDIVQEQNGTREDKSLEKLDKNEVSLLEQNTVEISEQHNGSSEHLSNPPTSSSITEMSDNINIFTNAENDKDCRETAKEASVNLNKAKNAVTTSTKTDDNFVVNIDFKAILESVKAQDDRLVKKEERMQKLEQNCAEVIRHISGTLKTGNEIIEKLNDVHETHKHQHCNKNVDGIPKAHCSEINDKTVIDNRDNMETTQKSERKNTDSNNQTENIVEIPTTSFMLFKTPVSDEEMATRHENGDEILTSTCVSERQEKEDRDSSEPSTSSEMDHEARFAARDKRLKSLEEQTKTLVSRVNQTTSKGVKINYKLEELHNIYGSENSRAGTPAEEDTSQHDEEDNDRE